MGVKIIFEGKPGSGKTLLSTGIARVLREAGFGVQTVQHISQREPDTLLVDGDAQTFVAFGDD